MNQQEKKEEGWAVIGMIAMIAAFYVMLHSLSVLHEGPGARLSERLVSTIVSRQ